MPKEYICPISNEIMLDPVVCSDGHTYERAAIETWFSGHLTSPVTNLPLAVKMVFPVSCDRAHITSVGLHAPCRTKNGLAEPRAALGDCGICAHALGPKITEQSKPALCMTVDRSRMKLYLAHSSSSLSPLSSTFAWRWSMSMRSAVPSLPAARLERL